ncbi:MAG: hypothetical protein AAFX79_13650 [Planctomycetota bacterium]
MDHENDNPIKADVEATKDFNDAADPTPEQELEEPMPTLELRPPEPMGPGLGDRAPGSTAERGPQVSPQLRGDEPEPRKPTMPLVKREFNREARKGVFREMFNRKARERDEPDLDR